MGPANRSKWITLTYPGARRKEQEYHSTQSFGMVPPQFHHGLAPPPMYEPMQPGFPGSPHGRSFTHMPTYPAPGSFHPVPQWMGSPPAAFHQMPDATFFHNYVGPYAALPARQSMQPWPSELHMPNHAVGQVNARGAAAEQEPAQPTGTKSQAKSPLEDAVQVAEPPRRQRSELLQAQQDRTANHKAKVSTPSVTAPTHGDKGQSRGGSKSAADAEAEQETPTGPGKKAHGAAKDEAPKPKQVKQQQQKPTSSDANPQTPDTAKASAGGKQTRASSTLSEGQVRDRQEAWHRIAMPLNPGKTKSARPKSKAGSLAGSESRGVNESPPGDADIDAVSSKSDGSRTLSASSQCSKLSSKPEDAKTTASNSKTAKPAHGRDNSGPKSSLRIQKKRRTVKKASDMAFAEGEQAASQVQPSPPRPQDEEAWPALPPSQQASPEQGASKKSSKMRTL